MLNQYGLLDTKAKERVLQDYAHFSLEMFRLNVPQKIGTFVPGISSASSDDVVPAITHSFVFLLRAFDDIRDYFDFLLEMKKHSVTIGGDDGGHLDELRVHMSALLDDLTSRRSVHSLLRCVLAHEDLNDMNILVDERGSITGVIDWEYQLIKPAILAAEYPPWLCSDACLDPRFADHVFTLWLESPEESERLRNLYLQIVRARDEEYWEALVQGTKLRSCVRWLTYTYAVDKGCIRMKRWMDSAFP
ncbi:hypothetical protein C0995_014325 [Termitomyces sp. Mi166|nr:hypothetical protein C0995_014325 [Termitomyces sp. Mi166\